MSVYMIEPVARHYQALILLQVVCSGCFWRTGSLDKQAHQGLFVSVNRQPVSPLSPLTASRG